ncbi:MAG TPA: NADH:flavin oxidoreductase [Gemmataceae bacterium]|nr:NADH:flavin oxidoreductase [Gemmataceae bacterium]
MAVHFKFHSAADLEAECRRLQLPIRLDADLSSFDQPANVGGFKVGNRWCVQPMEGCDGTSTGAPGELTFRRYQRYGAGGAKFIWGEAAAVVEEGRATPRQLLVAPEHAPAFAEIVRSCRAAHRKACGRDDDLFIGLQLTHSGRYSYRRPLIAFHDPLLDPRTLVDRARGERVTAAYPPVDDEYLRRLVDPYVAAAKLAYQAGFHFVDIKQCHRYLLNELLAARTRPGPYGGCFENRTRLARDIITAIRVEVPGILVASRLNAFDGVPYQKSATGPRGEPAPWQPLVSSVWGTNADNPLEPDLSEPKAWIAEMHRLGVVCINVTLGNPYASPHLLRPFEYPPPDGYETPEHPLVGVARHFAIAGELQHACAEMPLVGSGYSYLQEFLPQAGAANLREGRIAFVGVGRASLSQPDFAKQVHDNGRLDRKRVCRTFSYCTALMRSKHNALGQFAAGCPPFDKEVYGPIWEEAKRKPKTK